jgi:hypothetical protein
METRLSPIRPRPATSFLPSVKEFPVSFSAPGRTFSETATDTAEKDSQSDIMILSTSNLNEGAFDGAGMTLDVIQNPMLWSIKSKVAGPVAINDDLLMSSVRMVRHCVGLHVQRACQQHRANTTNGLSRSQLMYLAMLCVRLFPRRLHMVWYTSYQTRLHVASYPSGMQ